MEVSIVISFVSLIGLCWIGLLWMTGVIKSEGATWQSLLLGSLCLVGASYFTGKIFVLGLGFKPQFLYPIELFALFVYGLALESFGGLSDT